MDDDVFVDHCWQCSQPLPEDRVPARDLSGHRLCDACNAELVQARQRSRP